MPDTLVQGYMILRLFPNTREGELEMDELNGEWENESEEVR
jgi:hypothetical protein